MLHHKTTFLNVSTIELIHLSIKRNSKSRSWASTIALKPTNKFIRNILCMKSLIFKDERRRMSRNIFLSREACLETGGRHFERMAFAWGGWETPQSHHLGYALFPPRLRHRFNMIGGNVQVSSE